MPDALSIINGRYQLHDRIGSGAMGAVYRVHDKLTDKQVALKQVRLGEQDFIQPTTTQSMTETIDFNMILAHEFKTLASLRHPNIISVLDYGFDDSRMPYFTMELLDGSAPITKAASNQSLDYKFDLILQMMRALHYLHHRGIIHCDLKPENVQVINDQVKLLDFGLALVQRDSSADDSQGTTRGTLLYMAPEMIQTGIATEATDLYGLGMIAYQLLADALPFDTHNVTELINSIIMEMPDVSVIEVDSSLQNWLITLLDKDPDLRPASITQAMRTFVHVAGIDVVLEDESIRRSYLQASEFVGREQELQLLAQGINSVTIRKQGSAWLIGGESGVGKSRLVDEIRTRALVRGLLVFSGQASKEDGSAYQLWQHVIHGLALQTELEDDELRVLKTLIPNLDKRLGRKVRKSQARSEEITQKRLASVLEHILLRLDRGIMVILEDLQWVGEGLRLLQDVTQFIKKVPVMIVASYRNDERPDLHISLSDMTLIQLEPFDSDKISELTQSILGDDLDNQVEIIDLLNRESAGNAFFAVQILEALAVEAGQLTNISAELLPDSLFTSGLDGIIRRRLNQVSEEVQSMLAVAAISGRAIDKELISFLLPDLSIEEHCRACLDARIVQVDGQNWSFSHDKIRDFIVRDLDQAKFTDLHRQVAVAIETVYADELGQYELQLAYHWEKAGNLEKAIGYLEKRTKTALINFENQDAINFLNQIIRLSIQLTEQPSLLQQSRWQRYAGEAKYAMRMIDESNAHFEVALQLLTLGVSDTPQTHQLEAATIYQRVVPIYLYEGQWEKAINRIGTATQIYQELGQDDHLLPLMQVLPWIHHFQGDFRKALNQFGDNYAVAKNLNDADMILSSLTGQALANLRLGEELAQSFIDEASKLIDDEPDIDSNSLFEGVAAINDIQNGAFTQALDHALAGLSILGEFEPKSFRQVASYICVVEALLSIWEYSLRDEFHLPDDYKKTVRQSTKLLHKIAQMRPVTRSRAWTYQAWFDRLNGKPAKALTAIEQAITEAQRLNMRYDEGLAYFHKGLNSQESQRQSLLEQALVLFESVEAIRDIQATKQELKKQ